LTAAGPPRKPADTSEEWWMPITRNQLSFRSALLSPRTTLSDSKSEEYE
jgi:hypothetical protein